jgi:DNA-directed RNA polymerase specialized sigma24 family protein
MKWRGVTRLYAHLLQEHGNLPAALIVELLYALSALNAGAQIGESEDYDDLLDPCDRRFMYEDLCSTECIDDLPQRRARNVTPIPFTLGALQTGLLCVRHVDAAIVQTAVDVLSNCLTPLLPWWTLPTSHTTQSIDRALVELVARSEEIRALFFARARDKVAYQDIPDHFQAWLAKLVERPPDKLWVLATGECSYMTCLKTWIDNWLRDQIRKGKALRRGNGKAVMSLSIMTEPIDAGSIQLTQIVAMLLEDIARSLGNVETSAFRKCILDGCSAIETAAELGIPVHQVYNAVQQVKRYLKQSLPDEYCRGILFKLQRK